MNGICRLFAFCAITLAFVMQTLDVPAEGLGKVIYARREGDGVLVHAEEGDLHISFPASTIVRICEKSALGDGDSPAIDTKANAPFAPFESLDPRFQRIKSEALLVEMERDPFDLKVSDAAGNLLLSLNGPGGLAPFRGKSAHLVARFDPAGPMRGFGMVNSKPQRSLDFASAAPPPDEQGFYLSPVPWGRLNDRCAILLRTGGQSSLNFPEAGKLQFDGECKFELFVCLATTNEHYWTTLQFLLARSMLAPKWLLGTGFTLKEFNALAEVRGLADRLSREGFAPQWVLFPASRPGIQGWNEPFRSLGLNRSLWENPNVNMDALGKSNAWPVFEVPSAFLSEAKNTSMRQFLDKGNGTKPIAASQQQPSAHVFSPFDYAESDGGALAEAISSLSEQGFSRWLLRDDQRTENHEAASSPANNDARRQVQRAEVWSQALHSNPSSVLERRFVLDREARADLNRRCHLLAPWTVDPKSSAPSDAIEFAGASALAGLPAWGLELPIDPEAYPTTLAMRRWIQAASFSPYVLFRAANWEKASFPAEMADLNYEFRRLFALKKRLSPWFYSLARSSFLTGIPMCRPLESPNERPTALLVGSDALFAVVNPDNPSTKLDLPEGDWIDLNTNETFQGGLPVEPKINASTIPAYVKRGSLIPYWGEADPSESVYFVGRLYPSEKGQFAFYEDEGEGEAYRDGMFAVTQFNWNYNPAENALDVRIAGPIGSYASRIPARDVFLQIHATRSPVAVFIDDKPVRRTRFVKGTSKLLELADPFQLLGETMPVAPTWDHDASSFIYLWLPQRSGTTKIKLYLQQSPVQPGAASY